MKKSKQALKWESTESKRENRNVGWYINQPRKPKKYMVGTHMKAFNTMKDSDVRNMFTDNPKLLKTFKGKLTVTENALKTLTMRI